MQWYGRWKKMLHQLVGGLSHCLEGFKPSFWWCRISSSHSMTILEIFFECFCDIPLDKTLQANSRMSQQFNCARCAGSLYQVWLPLQPVSRCAQKDFIFWSFFTLNASTLVSCKADDCRLHAAGPYRKKMTKSRTLTRRLRATAPNIVAACSCASVAALEATASSMLGYLWTLETRAFSWKHQAMVKAAKDPRKPMVWAS